MQGMIKSIKKYFALVYSCASNSRRNVADGQGYKYSRHTGAVLVVKSNSG